MKSSLLILISFIAYSYSFSQATDAKWGFSNNSLNIIFSDSSSNSPTSWLWDFGDGNTSTQQNPSHIYLANGTYTVCLTATNSFGTDSTCKTVNVSCALPDANWGYNDSNRTVSFSDSTSNSPVYWLWDFGDGNTSTLVNPTHTYATNGAYTVCLTTVNPCGTDSTCKTVVIATTGVSTEQLDVIKLYPNPSNSRINISFPNSTFSVEIYDSKGSFISSFNESKEFLSIDLNSLYKGVYAFRIYNSKSYFIRKVVKE
jgi:PKD repeat protein